MVLVIATRDIAPNRPHVDDCFEGTRDLLRSADLVFGQLASFSEKDSRLPQARHAGRVNEPSRRRVDIETFESETSGAPAASGGR